MPRSMPVSNIRASRAIPNVNERRLIDLLCKCGQLGRIHWLWRRHREFPPVLFESGNVVDGVNLS